MEFFCVCDQDNLKGRCLECYGRTGCLDFRRKGWNTPFDVLCSYLIHLFPQFL